MTQKKHPARTPQTSGEAESYKFAQVVEALKALQERQEQMGLDLSALREGIDTLANQVAQVVEMCGEQSDQEQQVRDLTQQVYDLQEQLTGLLTPPPPEEGGGGPSPATTPASSSGPSPATSPASSSGRPSSTPQIDAARARRAAHVPRVGGSAG